MTSEGAVVVVGGTRAIGLEIARHYAEAGSPVVITGQSRESVDAGLASLPDGVQGVSFDLADPASIDAALAGVGPVRRLVLVAIDRDANSIADYSIERAVRLVTLKLVGFTQVIVSLRERLTDDASLVLFGGMAKERPYPGSTTVSTVNGGVVGLTRTLVEELKPLRVNSIHPGIVGDSPYWAEKPAAIENYTSQTPTGRLARMQDIVGGVVFLLENEAVNGVDLIVDGGWHTR
ncbi:MAG TPA: SDR family oxidoreductase [Candidatus Limnocylindrales bacterium]|jgi:NAD(P)-dependent dehydrogenase (short-subunit alcohol dehydrogenase family)|nr:SDR family oxidoreductase [Candidatus Limnocylindrales bacterium]